MKLAGFLPAGVAFHSWGQRRFGNLQSKPLARSSQLKELISLSEEFGQPILGARILEVGSGHIPRIPIGLFLAGAESVATVDLNRRMQMDLVRQNLEWIAANPTEFAESCGINSTSATFRERHALLAEHASNPPKFFRASGIQYFAPTDASKTDFPNESFDLHCSVTTLEHIPPKIIRNLLIEAHRILTPRGLAIHLIDPSDHFSHQDETISAIHFLKYSKRKWNVIAGNEFAYCNRLRADDYVDLVGQTELSLLSEKRTIDDRSLQELRAGFVPHKDFNGYSKQTLATTSYQVVLQPKDAKNK